MNRTEVIRTIQDRSDLDEERKLKLIGLIKSHPYHFKLTLSWIEVIRKFVSDSFEQMPPDEKSETLRTLARPMREKNRGHVVWPLLEVFLGEEGMVIDAGVFIPSRFVEMVLKRLRNEDDQGRKLLLIEILLLCSQAPPGDSTPEDYLPGFHCRDELFRCKILHFLYKYYKETPLSLVIKEIPWMKPAPTPLFYGTLTYFMRLHPEINWVEQIEAVIRSNSNLSRNGTGRDGLMLLFEEMKMSALRHQVLSFETEANRAGQDPVQEHKQAIHELCPSPKPTGIRLARFRKIGSRMNWR